MVFRFASDLRACKKFLGRGKALMVDANKKDMENLKFFKVTNVNMFSIPGKAMACSIIIIILQLAHHNCVTAVSLDCNKRV